MCRSEYVLTKGKAKCPISKSKNILRLLHKKDSKRPKFPLIKLLPLRKGSKTCSYHLVKDSNLSYAKELRSKFKVRLTTYHTMFIEARN